MPKLVDVRQPEIELVESGPPMTTSKGVVAQGMKPVADDDDRYFERMTHPDGRVTWLELLDD
jgi:hypothetical protein